MTRAAPVHDPVCHMDIDPDSAAATSEFEGATYYFCALGCKHDFDANPAGILAEEATYDHGRATEQASHAGSSRRPWWKFWA